MNHEFKFRYDPNEPKAAMVLLKKHTRGDVDRLCIKLRRHRSNVIHIYCDTGIDTEMIDYALKTAREATGIQQIVIAYEAVESR